MSVLASSTQRREACEGAETVTVILIDGHKGIVDDDQIVTAGDRDQIRQVQLGLIGGIELSGIHDNDLAVVAGEEGNEGIAGGFLQNDDRFAVAHIGLNDLDGLVTADKDHVEVFIPALLGHGGDTVIGAEIGRAHV